MTGSNLKTPKQGATGSLLMIPLNTNLETDAVCWKQTLEAVQQSPSLLKQEDRGVNTSVGKLEKENIVFFGSSYGNGMGQMFQENLGSKFEVCSIFKPNAPLVNIVEDVRKLGKDLTKQDHIVRGVGTFWIQTRTVQ